MKKHLLTLLLCFLAFAGSAQTQKYSRVKIWTGDAGLRKLSSLGIETDHGDYRKNVWFISDFSESEINRVAAAGFRYDIIIDDVSAYYRSQINAAPVSRTQAAGDCEYTAPVYATPSNFSLGSYAGYFTYQEMLDNLDSMASKFPNLITIKQALPGGTTLEGNSIYYLKISDNASVDETEPEMLYTAVHHAREPGGMSQLIFYMWYLLENYSTDAEIAAIVDNTELFFVPCINPDGYMFNEMTDPAGGGMWRKNRRDNLDGTFGVDLNRNYGYNWGYDDDGSSPDSFGETYRGTSGFSEPETQLIRDFAISRTFQIALNYHTFGNLLIYPWGYEYSIYTPDSALYTNYGELMTTYNGYTFGTADQTVGYIVNGSSDDWMYGEQVTKPKIFAMTPECGDALFGFWPPSSDIIPLCQNTMYQNITAAHLVGKYAKLIETSPKLISNGGGYIHFDLKQLGLDTTGTYTISLTAITPNIFTVGSSVTHGNLNVLEVVSDSISYALTSPMTNGEAIKFLMSIDNGQYVLTDTVIKYFGPATIAFASDCNSLTGWTFSSWGISTSIFYSPTASITDSPIGDYQSNSVSNCTQITPVNLATAVKATLSFYARWALEPNFDYVQIQATNNGGATWTALCGNYTVPGGGYQIPDEPLYEGFQLGWVKEEISLDDYIGGNVNIRFVLGSDWGQEYDGFYFDDVTITTVLPGTNSIPESTDISITSVMPNPASEYVFVNFNNRVSNAKINIYDTLGKLVLQQNVSSESASIKIQTASLKSGVYFVRLENKGISSTPAKLVIK